jgi:phenylalanyl-tRNA synthetase beta chain
MKVSYKHIVNYISDKPDIESLSDKLFHLGHEHEINGDIIDLELTPNRGDCLSLIGLLRDLNLFYEIKIKKDLYEQDINKFDFKFENNAQDVCPKVSFLKIDIDSIPETYNQEIENYFSDMDIKKNNFFTDISNFISYETGQPTHCYEAKGVQSGLRLDFLKEKQQFKTLLGKTIEVNEGDLVFLNNNKIVNLAGVVGSECTSCNKNTKSVILECAYFVPEQILGKAIKYSINSDAAYKFERSVDPNCHDWVIRRFISIVEQHTNIINLELCSNIHTSFQEKLIELDINKINNILGTNISVNKCKKYLESFGFTLNDKSINVPSYRNDVININDIAEEIARAIGYNNIKTKKFSISAKKENNSINCSEINIKSILIKNGFHEVINDPFTSENNQDSIEVDNPLDSSRKFLRTNLRKSLLQNFLYNERRQHESIKLFEIADIYSLSSNVPQRFIGIIVSGRLDNNHIDFSKKLDKKYLYNFLSDHFDNIELDNVDTIDRSEFKSKSNNTIAYLEIELDKLKISENFLNENYVINNLDKKYVPISQYPSSTRDLSFSVTNFSESKTLQEYLLNFKNILLKDVFIFDYFYNEKKAEIKIGFRFVFESKKETITEEEINKIMKVIYLHVNSMSGVCIPGLDV